MKDNIIDIALHAEELFTKMRWPDGPVCPSCSSHQYYKLGDGRYKCRDCGRIYSIKSDSLFHGSKLPISYWLVALYLMVDSKGISSCELSRKLSVTQKTAYYMLMRLRYAMDQSDVILEDEIAHDEVYLGGTWRNFSLSKRTQLLQQYHLPRQPRSINEKVAIANAVNYRYKTPVFGMNDGTRIVLQTLTNPVSPDDIYTIFKEHSGLVGHSVADCSNLYKDWKDNTGWDISYNNHSKGQFIAEDGRTSNRIEGTFSWIKRAFGTTYVHMKRCYVQLYLNEFCWRWNTRHLDTEERLQIAFAKCSRKVNRDDIRRLNNLEDKLLIKDGWFNPEEFFKNAPFINKVERNSVVYRREDFL